MIVKGGTPDPNQNFWGIKELASMLEPVQDSSVRAIKECINSAISIAEVRDILLELVVRNHNLVSSDGIRVISSAWAARRLTQLMESEVQTDPIFWENQFTRQLGLREKVVELYRKEKNCRAMV